jgi:hypothetical protein
MGCAATGESLDDLYGLIRRMPFFFWPWANNSTAVWVTRPFLGAGTGGIGECAIFAGAAVQGERALKARRLGRCVGAATPGGRHRRSPPEWRHRDYYRTPNRRPANRPRDTQESRTGRHPCASQIAERGFQEGDVVVAPGQAGCAQRTVGVVPRGGDKRGS